MEHVMEEPFPGWLRVEVEGKKPFYKSPFPRTVIRSAAMLKGFLAKEQAAGRMIGIDDSQFTFKRKYGVKAKVVEIPPGPNEDDIAGPAMEGLDNHGPRRNRSVVDLLTRDPDKFTDHKKLLSCMSKQIDGFQPKDAYQKPRNFDDLKKKLSAAVDMKDIFACILEDNETIETHTAAFSDMCLAEISQINIKNSPLVEFPSSINENIYCKIAEYGMTTCPQLISFVINMVVRKEDPVLPSDVMKITTLFSQICHSANHSLDALVKIRSLTMQLDGLSNLGLDVLSDCGLTQCSRSLSNHRDLFAEVGRDVMENTAASFPYQSILDNCDMQSEHLTVEVVEKETIDTSDLSTERMSKEEALKLFKKEQVLLGSDQNKEELKHFLEVIGVAAGKILAANRPEAKKLADNLPAHHTHKNSHLKPTPAITFILKPYPYTETKNPDMIKLLVRLQRMFLHSVAKALGSDPDFLEKLQLLEDPDVENDLREDAEESVKKVVLKFGVWIGSGDLLTVKMVQEATMLRPPLAGWSFLVLLDCSCFI